MKNFHGRIHLYESLAPAKEYFIGHAQVFEESEASEVLTPKYQTAPSVDEIMTVHYEKTEGIKDEVNKMQYVDLHQWMPKDILLKADKLSYGKFFGSPSTFIGYRSHEIGSTNTK